jgi:hypothetical protein
MTKQNASKVFSFDALVFFFLVIMMFTSTEVFIPINNNFSGLTIFYLFVKKYCGHFAFAVIGSMLLGYFYQRGLRKKIVYGLIGGSLAISVFLHSLVNQIGLGIGLGPLLEDGGVSQELFISFLFVLACVFLVAFLVWKGKFGKKKVWKAGEEETVVFE